MVSRRRQSSPCSQPSGARQESRDPGTDQARDPNLVGSPVVKRQKLLQHLRAHGCVMGKEGRKHTRVMNPSRKLLSFVPRHSEIKKGMAVEICKQLDIPPPAES